MNGLAPTSPVVGPRGAGYAPARVPMRMRSTSVLSAANRDGVNWWAIGGILALLGTAAWYTRKGVVYGTKRVGAWRVGRLESKARYHESRAEEKLAAAKAIALSAGLSPATVKRLEREASSDSEAAKNLAQAVDEQSQGDIDEHKTFARAVKAASRVAGPRTGPKGSRPRNEWRRAYNRIKTKLAGRGAALPEPGSERFLELVREMKL